jgi:hypothetical protein
LSTFNSSANFSRIETTSLSPFIGALFHCPGFSFVQKQPVKVREVRISNERTVIFFIFEKYGLKEIISRFLYYE